MTATVTYRPGMAVTRNSSRRHHHQFINTGWSDIELHHYLSRQATAEPPLFHPTEQSMPKIWRQPSTNQKHGELLYYCKLIPRPPRGRVHHRLIVPAVHDTAYLSLLSFSSSNSQLRNLLMPMALVEHDTVSGRAFVYAILAFSCLHRSGLHQQTMQLKIAALRALSESAKEAAPMQGTIRSVHHVAACMLLCAFETMLPSESSGDWLVYIRAAVDIAQVAQLGRETAGLMNDDIANLLDWVFYHSTLSRFAMYHWRHKSDAANHSSPTGATQIESVGFLKRRRYPMFSR